MARRRKWLRLGIITSGVIALLFGVGGYVALPHMLPSAIIYAPNAKSQIDPKQDDQYLPARTSLHLRIPVGPPAASISCLTIPPPNRAKPLGTILVLHGIRDDKRSQLGTGTWLSDLGYRAVLVDHRGHGRSTGKYLTYGVHESRDMVQVLDHLEKKGLLAPPVGAVGFSYGGAVALQLAARDKRIKAVVTVATFASLREVLPAYVSHYVPILGGLLTSAQIEGALEQAGEQAGFDPDEASNTKAAATTSAQLLIIHGQDDPKVPADHAQRIHQAARSRSKLMVVPGEDHDSILADRSGLVRKKMTAWFKRWLTDSDGHSG